MYYLRYIPINLRLKYALRMVMKNLKDTRGMAERTYQAAIALKKKYGLLDKDILEIGAGDRGGLCSILSLDNRVVALDLPERTMSLTLYLKTMIRRLFFDPIYYYHLNKFTKDSLHKNKMVYGDACHTRFADHQFDIIISNLVLEHIPKGDIDELARENMRLLRYGGIADHNIAIWTHLYGGHTFGWQKGKPWAHLRDKDFIPPVYLNRLKISDYEIMFIKHFGKDNVVIETTINPKAFDLLTNKVFSELSSLGYTRKDLAIGSARIIAKKNKYTE